VNKLNQLLQSYFCRTHLEMRVPEAVNKLGITGW